MPDPNKRQLTPTTDLNICLVKILLIAVPIGVTLLTVDDPGTLQIRSPDPTPGGYTWSLLIYLLPIAVLYAWFSRHPKKHPWWAFHVTLLILVPLGFALDIFLANTLFEFQNVGAHLNLYLWGYDFEAYRWVRNIPIEEFIFYFAGFVVILLTYVWADEYWQEAYNIPDYVAEVTAKETPALFRVYPYWLYIGLALIALAWVYKKFGNHPYHEGFPLYFTFLVATAMVPSFMFLRVAKNFINWRAFSTTLFYCLLTSVLWEATLAIPYGWWGYKPHYMMGLFIGAWSHLPVEATILWVIVTFSTVTVYETIKIARAVHQGTGKSVREIFFGGPNTSSAR